MKEEKKKKKKKKNEFLVCSCCQIALFFPTKVKMRCLIFAMDIIKLSLGSRTSYISSMLAG